jgi:hypothetical protein
MKSLKKIAALTLVAVCTFGNASVVTFNSAPDNNYFSGPVTSDGFTVAGTIHQGTFSDFDGRGQTNGTVYYGIWNNAGLTTSGFTLTAADNSLFSLMAFDFDNAYPGGGARTTSLTLTGTLADVQGSPA